MTIRIFDDKSVMKVLKFKRSNNMIEDQILES